MSIITLNSGRVFDFSNPSPESVDINDIAHALSRICRFTGHTDEHYSVAQHSCHVADMCKKENKFPGLMHDSPEYVVGDMNHPLKQMTPQFKKIEKSVWENAICPKFGLDAELPDEVKEMDYKIFLIETVFLFENRNDIIDSLRGEIDRLNLAIPRTFDVWSSERAYDEFITRFHILSL